MKIRGIIIKRASKILNILNKHKDSGDKKDFYRLIQVYECRILGFCIYRTEQSYRDIENDILKGHQGEARSVSSQKDEEKSCCFHGDCIHLKDYKCHNDAYCTWKC